MQNDACRNVQQQLLLQPGQQSENSPSVIVTAVGQEGMQYAHNLAAVGCCQPQTQLTAARLIQPPVSSGTTILLKKEHLQSSVLCTTSL